MIFLTWEKLKTINGVWGYKEDNKEYCVFKSDGGRVYGITFDKSEIALENSDCKDFYTNFKDDIDNNKYPLEIRRSNDNKTTVQVSSREVGTFLFWTSSFDQITAPIEIGGGQLLGLEIADSDVSKEVEGQFLDDVFIEDGLVFYENAPYGACVSFSVICPAGGYYYKSSVTGKPCAHDNREAVVAIAENEITVVEFVKNVMLYGNNYNGLLFDSADFSKVPSIYKLKMKVKNADIGQDFKVWAVLKGCRKTLTND